MGSPVPYNPPYFGMLWRVVLVITVLCFSLSLVAKYAPKKRPHVCECAPPPDTAAVVCERKLIDVETELRLRKKVVTFAENGGWSGVP